MFYSNLIVQENENKDVEFPQITLLISDKAGVVNTWFYRLNLLIFFFFICQINPLLAPGRVSEK